MVMIKFIIPSIGRPTLHRTLRSLKNQTDPDWRALLIMDGVDIDIGNDVDKRIRIMRLEKKTGERNFAGRVRNAGMDTDKESSWFAFVDDDDTVTMYYMEILKKAIREYPETDVFIFRMHEFNISVTLPPFEDTDFQKNAVGISFAMRSSLFHKEGFRFNSLSTEDYDLLDRMRSAQKIIRLLPEVGYHIRA
jgi:glycosyltransferase involved in cell wall biosynthesis